MGSVPVTIAHIGGIPVEETLAMVIPILGAGYVAIVASIRARRRVWKRGAHDDGPARRGPA